MALTEVVEWQGVSGLARWRPGVLPAANVTQVSGVCLTDNSRIVLVSEDGRRWNLPGGKPEDGESWPATLKRELWEEACAEVLSSRYLGTQQIEGLTAAPYHQLRFSVRVRLRPFDASFETKFRRTVPPEEVVEALSWGPGLIARAVLNAALGGQEL